MRSADSVRTGSVAGVLLLLGTIGTVAVNVLGRFALGLSEDSAAKSFASYRQHAFPIALTYGVGMVAGLLFIVAAPLLYLRLGNGRSPRLLVAAICQALAGLMLALSASRWLIVLPFLQKQYEKHGASAASRAALSVDYDNISYFLGITLGEHLFAIFTGCWTVIVATHLLRVPIRKRWLGWLGCIAGVGWLLGSIEQLDFAAAAYFIVFFIAGAVTWLIWTAFLARLLTKHSQA